MESIMWLMIYYTLLSFVGVAIAAALCVAIEQQLPWLSLPMFFLLFALVLWGAWRIAVWLTRPEASKSATETPGRPAQRA
jgi:hypothetical protein